MSFRIGNGYDVHRFADEELTDAHISLGGMKINARRELLAHSDGDVLLHALCDALLGALALGDIGKHFPDSDPQYKGINSLRLLENVITLVHSKGWSLANADMTIVAQAPKLAPYIQDMRVKVAGTLGVAEEQVSIKATTTEGLGFAGREEGIAVYAVVLLEKTP